MTVDIVRMLSNEDTRPGVLSIVTLLLKEFCSLSNDPSNFRPLVAEKMKNTQSLPRAHKVRASC